MCDTVYLYSIFLQIYYSFTMNILFSIRIGSDTDLTTRRRVYTKRHQGKNNLWCEMQVSDPFTVVVKQLNG